MKSTSPIDLLRELREGFAAEAGYYREAQRTAAVASPEFRANSAKAYAAESAMQKIDNTLRDWA